MIKGKIPNSSRLAIYAPPGTNFSLELNDGRIWNSRDAGVVFFVTSAYAEYTSGEWISRLLNVLVEETSTKKIWLRANPILTKKIPDYIKGVQISGDFLCGYIDVEDLCKIHEFFDSTADYGVWHIYSSDLDNGKEMEFKWLEDVIDQCDRYHFIVEVDVDGGLRGYVYPKRNIEELVLALSRIGSAKKR